MANKNRVSKYSLIDPESKKIDFVSPTEANKLIDKATVIGLHQQGITVRASSFFKNISIIGEDSEQEAFTVIRQYIGLKEKEFELSDGVGATHTVSEKEVRTLLEKGVKINGIQLRPNGTIAVNSQIEVYTKSN